MIDRTVALDKLMGFTKADDVASFLESQDVQGRQFEHLHCPLARWLRETTEAEWVSVAAKRICWPDTWRTNPLTPALRQFVTRFDRGKYPQLIDDGQDETPAGS